MLVFHEPVFELPQVGGGNEFGRKLITIDLRKPASELTEIAVIAADRVAGTVQGIEIGDEVVNDFGHGDHHAMELCEVILRGYWALFTARNQQNREKSSHNAYYRRCERGVKYPEQHGDN